MAVTIGNRWDGPPLPAAAHVNVGLAFRDGDNALVISVDAPFFNSPERPPGEPGQPFLGLWDYEVVEVFLLGRDAQYLEVELCPHGQHLVLLLRGPRGVLCDQLPLAFRASLDAARGRWTGEAAIPPALLPPGLARFNAYAIHGPAADRHYSALFPATGADCTHPDFHRLEYFGALPPALLQAWRPPATPPAPWR